MKEFQDQLKSLIEFNGENKGQWYEQLKFLFEKYVEALKLETSNREIEKHKLLIESNLKINLSKFKGYDSMLYIFTFKQKFEKFHLRTTPKHLFPDLLKNNYLEQSALSLVKDSNDIDEICMRLRRSFGDPQIMLNKKLQQIEK